MKAIFILKPYENLSLSIGNYLEKENSKSEGKNVLQSIHRSWFHFPLAPSGGKHSVLLIPTALTGRIYYKYYLTLKVLLISSFLPKQPKYIFNFFCSSRYAFII